MKYTKPIQKKMALAEEQGLTVYAVREGEELGKAYKRLAKVADQRLVSLEAYQHEQGFEGVLTYAYARAIEDIKTYSGEGAKRFNTKAPANLKTLERKVNDILRFLNSPTSTKRGVESVYKKRAETINKKYGTNFSWQELGRFFEQNIDAQLEKAQERTSDLILIAIGNMQAKKDEIVKEIREANDKHITVSEEDVNNAIYDALKKDKISLDMLSRKNKEIRAKREARKPKKSAATKKKGKTKRKK